MGQQVTIGGERLGTGKKSKAYLHGYERSNHDKSFIWRSTMAPGTLVPCWTELALPGDTFDINLQLDALTLPTIGPLFGTYQIEVHVFQMPIRPYIPQLQMNQVEIGMNMKNILLPQIQIKGRSFQVTKPIDNQQIHPSCIYSYLGIRGVGYNGVASVVRQFNAVPFLMYWDTVKQYFSNKQEEIGAVIHKDVNAPAATLDDCEIAGQIIPVIAPSAPITYIPCLMSPSAQFISNASLITSDTVPQDITIYIQSLDGLYDTAIPATELFEDWYLDASSGIIGGSNPKPPYRYQTINIAAAVYEQITTPTGDGTPTIKTFPLSNIDLMRKQIMQEMEDGVFLLGEGTTRPVPYNYPNDKGLIDTDLIAQQFAQEGLALKTYKSDLFNNWIQTDWIDGAGGISEITSIDTSSGSITIDEINMKKKLYLMFNRIAISGGTYNDWMDVTYDVTTFRQANNPMFLGGLIQNIVFQEVISNTSTPTQPLGTLAGRGRLGNKRKGGNIIAKIDEPSYLMAIVSITPNIDYSQGNQWDNNLRTMDDLHKPQLDEIGFQDLTTDQMAWFDTQVNPATKLPTFNSAGKQPAWINYMTNVNVVRGAFADQTQQMFMTLNRRYSLKTVGASTRIKDVTTYVDPTKYNYVFADTRLDAQNFWVQIGFNIEARRKMSAKVMPNL